MPPTTEPSPHSAGAGLVVGKQPAAPPHPTPEALAAILCAPRPGDTDAYIPHRSAMLVNSGDRPSPGYAQASCVRCRGQVRWHDVARNAATATCIQCGAIVAEWRLVKRVTAAEAEAIQKLAWGVLTNASRHESSRSSS